MSTGKYKSYTAQQRAQIRKYAAEHGPTNAAVHFSSLWKISINESTARRLKLEYLDALCEVGNKAGKYHGKEQQTDCLCFHFLGNRTILHQQWHPHTLINMVATNACTVCTHTYP